MDEFISPELYKRSVSFVAFCKNSLAAKRRRRRKNKADVSGGRGSRALCGLNHGWTRMDTDSNSRGRIFPRNTRLDAKGSNIACGGPPQARGAPREGRASIRRSAPDDFNVRDHFVSFVAFCKNSLAAKRRRWRKNKADVSGGRGSRVLCGFEPRMDTDSDLQAEADGIFPRNTRIGANDRGNRMGGEVAHGLHGGESRQGEAVDGSRSWNKKVS